MAGESQQTPKTEPDPSVMTTEQLDRAVASVLAYVDSQFSIRDERLRGIDRATMLRLETMDRIPDVVDEKVGHLASVMEERFLSVGNQFKERDIRAEREARDNKVAVDAAFAAQKEAAARQDEANQKSIDKSEKATDEKINKLEQLFKTTTDALADKIEDGKLRVNTLELSLNGQIQGRNSVKEATTERQNTNAGLYALGGFVVAVIVASIAVIGFLAALKP